MKRILEEILDEISLIYEDEGLPQRLQTSPDDVETEVHEYTLEDEIKKDPTQYS